MRRLLVLAIVVAGVLLLAVIERSLGPRVVAGRLPTAAAQWIWAGADDRGLTPRAFHAVRDFDLAAPPPAAEALILADEEYILYLNGERVGSNRYRPGAPLDRYAVAHLLRAGRNRVLVELRSGRRAGGLLFRLSGADGLEIESGPDWAIALRHRELHFDPGEPLVRPHPPRVWGSPPVGRWRLPTAGAPRPLFAELRDDLGELRPQRALAGEHWQGTRRLRPSAPPLGTDVTFDWGRPVTGYLHLFFGSREWPKALLYFGTEPTGPGSGPAAAALGARGRLLWSDVVPRRFRYVRVVAPQGVRGAYVLATDPARSPLESAPPPVGVFGVTEPPPLVSAIENEIRGELESVAGVAGGQGG